MIKVDRCRKLDGKVIQPSAAWFKTAKELTKQAIQDSPAHQVTDHYQVKEVRLALEALFYDKCAYCETKITPASSWEVEHYRPKGRVAKREDHPGYYWLAYDWNNLVPACTFCNQRRKDKPRFSDRRELPAQGKLDQFPVEDENHRAMTPAHELAQERPYLLNPNVDDPEQHLTYDPQGQIQPMDKADRSATETIRICHLTRRRLRDDRARIIIQVHKVMRLLRLAREQHNDAFEQGIQGILAEFVAPKATSAGAARAVQCDPDAFGG